MRRGARLPFPWLPLLWALSWAVYALYFQGQWVYGARPIVHITGDEPHYLVIATSLMRDGDLDVLNNYRQKDYQAFYPYHLGDARSPEDMHAVYGRNGGLYSKHGLGLPLALLPAMRLGGHGLAIVFMMGIAATLSLQTYLLARDVTERRLPALAAWVAVAFTSPLLLYADQIYPEIPGALLTVIGVRAVLRGAGASTLGEGGESHRGAALHLGVAVGLLPWLHLRYIPLAAALAVAGLAVFLLPAGRPTSERLRRLAPPLLGPPGIAGMALLLLNWRLFGGTLTVDEYGALGVQNLLAGLPGLLVDRQFGLLVYAPIYLVALYGLPLIRRRLPGRQGGTIMGALGLYVLFIAAFSEWYGAYSPPSRMLVPVVPLLVVPLALALERWTALRFRLVFIALLFLSWSVARLLLDVPRLRYNQPTGRSELLGYLSAVWGRDLTGLFPSFIHPTAGTYIWLGVAALLTWALGRALTAERHRPLARSTLRHRSAGPVERRPLVRT